MHKAHIKRFAQRWHRPVIPHANAFSSRRKHTADDVQPPVRRALRQRPGNNPRDSRSEARSFQNGGYARADGFPVAQYSGNSHMRADWNA